MFLYILTYKNITKMNIQYNVDLARVSSDIKGHCIKDDLSPSGVRMAWTIEPPKNPFTFKLEEDKIFCFQKKPKKGTECFKMTTRVLVRSHSGYCSCLEMADGGPEYEEEQIITTYYRIPYKLKNRNHHLRTKYYDTSTYEIKECKETEDMFREWQHKSVCDNSNWYQSGYCDYHDAYIPIRLVYVIM